MFLVLHAMTLSCFSNLTYSMCQLCTFSQLFQRFTAITLSILRVFSVYMPLLCQVFYILLTPCTNFEPLHIYSVSPPPLCQFYVFYVFTCHNILIFSYFANSMYQLCTTSQHFQRFTAITLSNLRVFSVYKP